MGREIRRVPPDWEHPVYTKNDAPRSDRVGDFRPLYDREYHQACVDWYREAAEWKPDEFSRWYHEYAGDPPSEDRYRMRAWTEEEAAHFQVYETVSEGTPVTPHFATKAELVDYLVANGDFWDQRRERDRWELRTPGGPGWSREAAERFVNAEWAPSMIVTQSATSVTILEPRDGGLPDAAA